MAANTGGHFHNVAVVSPCKSFCFEKCFIFIKSDKIGGGWDLSSLAHHPPIRLALILAAPCTLHSGFRTSEKCHLVCCHIRFLGGTKMAQKNVATTFHLIWKPNLNSGVQCGPAPCTLNTSNTRVYRGAKPWYLGYPTSGTYHVQYTLYSKSPMEGQVIHPQYTLTMCHDVQCLWHNFQGILVFIISIN